jgi:hypothetical protein
LIESGIAQWLIESFRDYQASQPLTTLACAPRGTRSSLVADKETGQRRALWVGGCRHRGLGADRCCLPVLLTRVTSNFRGIRPPPSQMAGQPRTTAPMPSRSRGPHGGPSSARQRACSLPTLSRPRNEFSSAIRSRLISDSPYAAAPVSSRAASLSDFLVMTRSEPRAGPAGQASVLGCPD